MCLNTIFKTAEERKPLPPLPPVKRGEGLILHLFMAVAFISSAAAEPASPGALRLKDCYQRAVNQSEQLLITQEDIQQAKARRKQALGSVLPDVRWLMTSTIQDTSGTSGESGGVGGTLTRRERTDSRFQAKQPLFQGFKEFHSISAYKAQARKAEAELMRDSVTLYLDVAQAFYRVMQLATFGKDLRVSIDLTEDRLKELRGRVRLGKSRSSEVLSSESQLASLKSQEAANNGNLTAARDLLGYYVGMDMRTVQLLDETPFPTQIYSEENAVRLGIERSDIRALKEDVEAKRAGLRVARSGYYPYLNLLGNYYTHRPGFQEEIDWDISLNIDAPIFQGGRIRAMDKEAKSQLRQAELQLSRVVRLAESEIKQAHAALTSSIRETEALEDAYDKARKSYQAQVREYRMGLVNNLDVLQAMNAMQDIKAKYDTAYLQTKLNVFKLRVVTEELP